MYNGPTFKDRNFQQFSTITFVSKQLKINDIRLGVFRTTLYNLNANYVNIMLKIGSLVKIEGD